MRRPFILVPALLAILAATIAVDMAGRAGSRTAADRADRWEACRIVDALGRPGPDASLAAAIDACAVIIRSGRQTRQDLAEAHLNRGIAYFFKDEIDRAIADYDKAIRLDPQNPLPFVRRADVFQRKGLQEKHLEAAVHAPAAGRPPSIDAGRAWFERALEDYGRAIRLRPDVNVFIRRGNTHLYMGEYDDGIADFSETLRLDPANAEALVNRAGTRNFLGDPERAIADYDTVIRVDPSWPLVFTARAFAYVAAGQFGRAIEDCDQALRLRPQNNLALSARCRARLGLGQLAAALADCDAALGGGRTSFTLNSRGMVHLRLGRPDLALADFQMTLTSLEPFNSKALYGRGLAKRMQGDAAGAEADITKAEQAAPGLAARFAAYGLPVP